MGEPDLERATQYALDRLERELPPNTTYHSLRHTRDDVLAAARRLAALEGVSGEALLCLLTAAAYHDLGHIQQRIDHETISAQIAGDALPHFGYSAQQVALIQSLIMATHWPPDPRTLLEKIIADADVDSLGREDFLQTSLNLRAELAGDGITMTDRQWYTSQLEFLENHHYHTAAAQRLRGEGKRRNVRLVQHLLAETHAEP